ncbi:glycosyltransferase [Acidimicrobiia bacterium]|nr:glycosyltransferase [Acidimicrobiia bacterium]
MNNKNIIYVFISGRKQKLKLPPTEYAKEFFYGYQHFEKTEHNVDIIEFNEKKSPLNLIYFILNKLSDLPLYGQYLINRENYKKLKSADEIIFTNQKTAFSMLPLLLFVKITRNINSHVFIMGLFGKTMKYRIKHFFREIFIKMMIISSKNLIFLGLGEYELAVKKYTKYKDKFVFLPFSIDTKFWNNTQLQTENNNILFIGNDGMRDYKFLEDLIITLPEYNFNVVSSKFDSSITSKNLEIFKGDWGTYAFSDNFIKELYIKCSLTILPIKNTYQPSGQSVTLQSMSVGTPVMITKTDGFWDPKSFIDRRNIYLVEKNEIEVWRRSIANFFEEKEENQKVKLEGKKLILEKYNLEYFNQNLEKIIFKN